MDSEKLDNIVTELEDNAKRLKGFTEIYTEIEKLQSSISKNLELIQHNNKNLEEISIVIKNNTKKNVEQLSKIKSYLEAKIEEIYKDNKSFQKELDASLITRLDKHKSDIQIEIRNEGTQIQRAFENTLNTNFKELDTKLLNEFKQQSKQFKVLKIIGIIAIFVMIAVGAALYFK